MSMVCLAQPREQVEDVRVVVEQRARLADRTVPWDSMCYVPAWQSIACHRM